MIEINNAEEKKKTTIKEIYKNINNVITGDVLANLAYSSMIMIYFMFFNIQYEVVSELILAKYINISSIVFLLISIAIIEISYRKEDDNVLIYGLEFLVLAVFTLLIKHIPKLLNCSTQTYILIGSYLFAIYYMLKSTILYTRERQEDLKKLSDIKEIVKDEPVKKASKRRNKKAVEAEVKEIKEEGK